MQSSFYVSHMGQQMGPYQVDEIVNLVGDGTLSPLDYVYDEAKGDWILFLEHEQLAERVKALKPKAPPKPAPQKQEAAEPMPKVKAVAGVPAHMNEFMSREWYVLKGENKFGPFAYTDVIKMLQQGVIFEFDFAWYNGLDTWKRIAELDAFSKENVRSLKETVLPEIREVFFRRRHKRVNYGGTCLIHDNKTVWKGKGVEISEGGAGIIMENSLCVPGQQLYLHFKPGDGVPPFNAICEIVSKDYVGDIRDPKAPVKYGLKFKTISAETQKFLHDYTNSASTGKKAA